MGAPAMDGLWLTSGFEDTGETFLYSVFDTKKGPDPKTNETHLANLLEGECGEDIEDPICIDITIRGQSHKPQVLALQQPSTSGRGCECQICTPVNARRTTSRHAAADTQEELNALGETHFVNCCHHLR